MTLLAELHNLWSWTTTMPLPLLTLLLITLSWLLLPPWILLVLPQMLYTSCFAPLMCREPIVLMCPTILSLVLCTNSPMTTTMTQITYPHLALSKIAGKPTFTSLLLLQCKLYANACSVYCPIDGNSHGYLGLIMSNEEYTMCDRRTFTSSKYSGSQPTPKTGTIQH